MNPNLVHSSSSWPAKDDTGPAVEAEPLELGVTILAVGADLADPDLVAHHLNRFLAAQWIPGKMSCIYVTESLGD